jgi:hypothetical protein
MRYRRLLVALVVGGAAFGIASAVQASIPDSDGIVHACYTKNNLHGYPTGALRAIDTDKINGRCTPDENPVDLATPQYVQNVVTSTINPTSFMIRASGTGGPGTLQGNFFCGTGYIATDFSVAASNNTLASNTLINVLTMYNEGEVLTGTPDTFGHLFATLTGSVTLTIHGTCVDGRVFGQPGPVAPINQAQKQATITMSVG